MNVNDEFDPLHAVAEESKAYDKEQDELIELEAQVRRRKQAYASVFSVGETPKEDLNFVLEDLATFSRAYGTRYNAEPRLHALAEGRAEVYYRITEALNLDHATLYNKYVQLMQKLGK